MHLKLQRFLSKRYAIFIVLTCNEFLINSGLQGTSVRPVCQVHAEGFSVVGNYQGLADASEFRETGTSARCYPTEGAARC